MSNYTEAVEMLKETCRDLDAAYTRTRILSEQIKKLRAKVESIRNHAYINKNNVEYQLARSALEAIDTEIYDKGLLINKKA